MAVASSAASKAAKAAAKKTDDAVKAGAKTASSSGQKSPIGVRIGDREKNQKTVNMQTSTKAVSGGGLTNKNDYFPSRKADVIKDQVSDVGILMKKKKDPSNKLISATQSAAKQRAAVRTGTRAVAAGASVAAGYAAGPDGEKKTKTVVNTVGAKDDRSNKEDFPKYGKSTESGKAFREAFNKAKGAGKDSFTFEGRKYNTKDKK